MHLLRLPTAPPVQVLADEPWRRANDSAPEDRPHLGKTNPESIAAGKGMLAIAKALGVGTSTVQRVKERSFIL
jgi:hypothetical protein